MPDRRTRPAAPLTRPLVVTHLPSMVRFGARTPMSAGGDIERTVGRSSPSSPSGGGVVGPWSGPLLVHGRPGLLDRVRTPAVPRCRDPCPAPRSAGTHAPRERVFGRVPPGGDAPRGLGVARGRCADAPLLAGDLLDLLRGRSPRRPYPRRPCATVRAPGRPVGRLHRPPPGDGPRQPHGRLLRAALVRSSCARPGPVLRIRGRGLVARRRGARRRDGWRSGRVRGSRPPRVGPSRPRPRGRSLVG